MEIKELKKLIEKYDDTDEVEFVCAAYDGSYYSDEIYLGDVKENRRTGITTVELQFGA